MNQHTLIQLRETGVAVLPDVVCKANLERLSLAYDEAFTRAQERGLMPSSSGSNIRLRGLLGEDTAFDELVGLEPVLWACEHIIGAPFKLSGLRARTVLPGAHEQTLHVDARPHRAGWPLVGFIVMVDAFHEDNGATRFVPGSHKMEVSPSAYQTNHRPENWPERVASGQAGSVIVYSGSIWHGFSGNRTGVSRRSIHGAYIPRTCAAAIDWSAFLPPEVIARLSERAKYILALE